MDIKKLLEQEKTHLLNELKKTSFKYQCLMLYFNVTKTWWDKIQSLIDEFDVTRVEGAYGREKYKDAHITILYGLYANVDIEDVKEKVQGMPIKDVRATEISYFEGPDHDVVYIKYDYVFLKELNKKVKQLPHTQTHPKYQPHMTLAYVKKGKGKKYAQKLSGDLIKTLKATEFVFSEKSGKKTKFKLK